MGCNNDLTEAIALGHDVGHTPFGHVGERTLNMIMNNCERLDIPVSENNHGFKHNLQSIRVLCDLEGDLNLSKYTLWGILNHSKLTYSQCSIMNNKCYMLHHPSPCTNEGILSCKYYNKYIENINGNDYWSIEGLVVALADEIAQRHHDIEDSIRFNILDKKALLEELHIFEPVFSPLDKENYENLKSLTDNTDDVFLAQFSRLIIKAYVVNLTQETKKRIRNKGKKMNFVSQQDFINRKSEIPFSEAKKLVGFASKFAEIDKEFHNYLKSSILNSYGAQSMDGKGAYIVRRLFKAYMSNPTQLPDNEIGRFYESIGVTNKTLGEMRGEMNLNRDTDSRGNHLMRIIADYISGMTDAYAYNQYNLLYGTMI